MVTFGALHNLTQLAAVWLSQAVPSMHILLLSQPQLSSSSLGEQLVLGAAPGEDEPHEPLSCLGSG